MTAHPADMAAAMFLGSVVLLGTVIALVVGAAVLHGRMERRRATRSQVSDKA